MEASDWIALAALAVAVLVGVVTAVWTVSKIQNAGDKLSDKLGELSTDVSGLTIVVTALKDGHNDHEQRIRRIENQR